MEFPHTRGELIVLCDGHVVVDLVQKPERKVSSLVPLLTTDLYYDLLESQSIVRKFNSLLREAYQHALSYGLTFEVDNYNGYQLVYNTGATIPSKTKLDCTRGFTEKIPENREKFVDPVSILEPTSMCSSARVMVGVCRFANHCCAPNCDYLASEYKGRKCVKLVTLKDVLPGQPLTVFYGPDYFDTGNRNCQCPHTEKHAVIQVTYVAPRTSTPRSSVGARRVNLRRRRFFTKTVEKTKKTWDYRDFSDVTSDSDCDPETLSFQIADPSESSSESDAEIFSTADPCSSITADACVLSPVLSSSRLVFMLDFNILIFDNKSNSLL